MLSKRSIKRESKLFALDLAIRMMDLTTLEGADTPGKVAALEPDEIGRRMAEPRFIAAMQYVQAADLAPPAR